MQGSWMEGSHKQRSKIKLRNDAKCIAHIQYMGWGVGSQHYWIDDTINILRLHHLWAKKEMITYKKWLSQCRWCFGMLIYLFTVVWGPVHNFCLSADTLSIIFLFYGWENYDDIHFLTLFRPMEFCFYCELVLIFFRTDWWKFHPDQWPFHN